MARTLVAITGASSGIGEAFARRLAPEHDLLLIARRQDRLQHLAAELGGAEVMAADLTQEADVARVADRIGGVPNLALLVNNAGFGTRGRFWETDYHDSDAMLKLHVLATAHLSHAALRNMVPRDFGAIINVASVAAFVRGGASVCYGPSKSFVATFTEALHIELKQARSNVAVQALCPGYTYSEFHDTLAVDRPRPGTSAWWHTAEDVVDQSIEGLRRRKLFVMPGWRYRLLTAIVTRVPTPVRLFVENVGSASRQRMIAK